MCHAEVIFALLKKTVVIGVVFVEWCDHSQSFWVVRDQDEIANGVDAVAFWSSLGFVVMNRGGAHAYPYTNVVSTAYRMI